MTIVKLKGGDKKTITAEDEEEIRRKAVEEYLRQKELEEKAQATDAPEGENKE